MCVGIYVFFNALQTCCTVISPCPVIIGFIFLYFFAGLLHFIIVFSEKKEEDFKPILILLNTIFKFRGVLHAPKYCFRCKL